MNIQFSFVMLIAVFLFYVASAGLLILLGASIKQWRWKWVVISPLAAAAIVAPWADEFLTARSFKQVCQDAGPSISQKVEVAGFLNATDHSPSNFADSQLLTDPGTVANFDRSGYQFSESLLKDGRVLHFERVDDGVKVSVLNQPQARYRFERPIKDADAGRAISCSEDTIVDLVLSKTFARYRYCKRYASFPERLWLGLLHAGPIEYCPIGDSELKGLLYRHVLIPKRRS